MKTCAIDIHHHYVPTSLLDEAKRHGKTLGVELKENNAAKVLEDAIRDLKLCGGYIGSNVNGSYYNGSDFDPFWAKAQELDALIVMHPEDVAGADKMNPYGLKLICGNPADSALCLGYMTYSGVFDRFPDLKLCVLHGGGLFPYHLARV